MDAKHTGALIAKRRKAMGLTQKQLAERLMISDKAVSKWENGASYPEVTLLPALAQLLGVTVDELLAGETRGESGQADDTPADADRQGGQADKPPGAAGAVTQSYFADRLGSVDDKMLLAAAVCMLAAAYCCRLYGGLSMLRDLVIVLVVYLAFRVWHSKQRGRFAALGVDTAVSHRRARVADRLFGAIWLVVTLTVLYFVGLFYWIPGEQIELTRIGRYAVGIGSFGMWFSSPGLIGCIVALALPTLALVGAFALAYRRMTLQTRFRPLAVALPALPCLVGAGVVGWQRVQTALAYMPRFGDPQPTYDQGKAMGLAIDTAGRNAAWVAAVVIVALTMALLAAWRRTHGRVPLVSAVLLAVDAAIWLPSGALWLEVGYEGFAQQPYATECITIELIGLGILLALTALCAGIALFIDSLRCNSGTKTT